MKSPHIVVFDLDGTLIDGIRFSYRHLWEHFGVDLEEDRRNFLEYRAKKISYAEWVRRDVELLQRAGAGRAAIVDALRTLRPMEGGLETLVSLKRYGKILGLISGSFDLVLETVYPAYRQFFDDIYINRYHFDGDGALRHATATPYDFEGKSEGLLRIAEDYGCTSADCAFIGDSDNDITAIRDAGLGIAFNPESDALRQAADIVIEGRDLRPVLDYLL